MSGPTMPAVLAGAASLQAALQQITLAGGYFNDVKTTSVTLDPVALELVPSTEVPRLIVAGRIEPVNRDFAGSRPVQVKDRWRYVIAGRIDAPGGADTSARNTVCAQLEADIEKALAVDPQRTDLATLTGGTVLQALYTYVGQATRFVFVSGDQTMCFIELPVELVIQRVYGKP